MIDELQAIYKKAWNAAKIGQKDLHGIAAVARHVFTTMMADRDAATRDIGKAMEAYAPVEPAKPEAGDWAMEAVKVYMGAEFGPDDCDRRLAETIREAAELHYGKKIRDLQNELAQVDEQLKMRERQVGTAIKERDAAVAECERLRAELLKLGASKPAAPPSPAPAATGEDKLMFLVINAIRNSGCSIDGEADAVLAAIRPPFDAVCAERDGARAANAGLRKCAEDAKHSAWELKQRAEAAEAELAKRPDDRSCLTALMKISKLLGLPGIVNPSDTVKAVEAMKAERDKLAAELASLVDEVADAQKADTNPSMARALMSINITAFRATKGTDRD